jgi:hypothetical protein
MAFVKSKWEASKFGEKLKEEALTRVTNDANPAFVKFSSAWYSYQVSDIETNRIYATASNVTTALSASINIADYAPGVGSNITAVYVSFSGGYGIGPALYKSSSRVSEYIYCYTNYDKTGFYTIPLRFQPHALYTTNGMTTSQEWIDVTYTHNAILPVAYNGQLPYVVLDHSMTFANVNTATSLADQNCSMRYGMAIYFYGFLR